MMEALTPKERDEYLVSQYVDGVLDDGERRVFERRLREEPRLADLLAEYREVDRLVRASVGAVPEVDWGRFAAQFTRRRVAQDTAARRWPGVFRVFAPLAAAAAIALALSLLYRSNVERNGIGGGAMVSAVEVDRPAMVGDEASVSIVAYSYDPGDSYDPGEADAGDGPVIAMAAVGKDVYWPTLAIEPDNPQSH